jgi:beta-lactamase class A
VRYTYNAATPMYLASTVKIFFLIELLRQAEAGQLDLDEPQTLAEEDFRDGSEHLGHKKPGDSFTLRELMHFMMHVSDNTATDLILRRVGIENVNNGLLEHGYAVNELTPMLDVRRNVFRMVAPEADALSPENVRAVQEQSSQSRRISVLNDLLKPAKRWRSGDLHRAWMGYYAEGKNSAPMEVMGAVLEDLVRGRVLGPKVAREALTLMMGCKTGKNRLRKSLPPSAVLAHKTGTQYLRVCNSGVLFVTPDRPVVIAACTKDFPTTARAESLLAGIGSAVYQRISATPLPSSAEDASGFVWPGPTGALETSSADTTHED